ncbi:MAG: autotransporter assembly complex family protein, partial [Chromatiales bacterium]
VEPGPPVLLQQVEVKIHGAAQNDPAFSKLLQQSPVRKGNQLHHGQYEKLKDQLEALASQRGYFDARFSRHQLQVDPATNQASIQLHYDSGPRYHIGKLELQQHTYDPALLQRYIKVSPGDAYDADALADMHRALADSGYFQTVTIKPDFIAAVDGQIDVLVQLQPIKRLAYRIGIGAATDTGPRVTLAYEKRRLNRRGHRLNAKATLSAVDSSVGLEYLIPMQKPHIDQLSLRTGFRHLDTDTSTSDTTTIGLRTIGKRNDWNEIRFLDWVSERSSVGGETSTVELLVPGISWSRTVADNRIQPRKGWRLNLELRAAEESLLSDVSFLQVIGGGKWIEPLSSGRLLMRLDAGYSLTPELTDLPASYRFFAGGDQSVRGYAFESLGPKNADGQVIGGSHLLTGSIEYEHVIKGDWSGAVFVDAGNAFDDWNEDLKSSAGLGLRWRSPVGPIRLDLAVPEDKSEDDFRIHFSMGSDL